MFKKLLTVAFVILATLIIVSCQQPNKDVPDYGDLRDSPFVNYKDKIKEGKIEISAENFIRNTIYAEDMNPEPVGLKYTAVVKNNDTYIAYYLVSRAGLGACFEAYICDKDGRVSEGSRPLMAYKLTTSEMVSDAGFPFAIDNNGTLQAGKAVLITDAINILKDDKSSPDAMKGWLIWDKNGNVLPNAYFFPGSASEYGIHLDFKHFDEEKHGWIGNFPGKESNPRNQISSISTYLLPIVQNKNWFTCWDGPVETDYIAIGLDQNNRPIWK